MTARSRPLKVVGKVPAAAGGRGMQTWGYCGDCGEWFLCVRRIDGVVASWTCPVCGLHPVNIEQHDVADAPVA